MTTNNFAHIPAVCPRCQQSFACRVDAIEVCQCRAVSLTDAQRHYVNLSFKGCLCADCLRTLQSEYNQLRPVR